MNVLDLFSGIGGFSLGLERAGMRTVAFCEIESYCRRVLSRHWPSVPIHDDIRQLDGNRYSGTVDLVCGGYPCQPFSVAGKQQGEADPRHLWPEMRRVIREARPRWVICENVRGHVSLGFDTVAAQLEDDGFTVWPFLVPACAVNAPHRRERLWIVANTGGRRRSGSGERQMEQSGRTEAVCSGQAMAYASNGSDKPGSPQCHVRGLQETVLRESRYSHDWNAEPRICRVANGIPNRIHRLRSLGNAVVPQIPELIGRTILAYEQQLGIAA